MDYTESAALMNDIPFRGRIKVASLKWTTYVMSEDPTTAGHTSRYRYAQRFAQQPDIEATTLQPMVVMDSQVQTDGAAITDAALQTSVETVIDKLV